VARYNHNKTEKRREKIILWQWYHLLLDVAVRNKSLHVVTPVRMLTP
jgi:hypothetical protein